VIGSSTRTGRVWTLAILMVAASLLVGTVAASAGASGDARAVAAKKKCKKAKKGAVSAKKKKCKKKHVLSIPGPLVRGTITWPSGEVDLHAFDSSGNRSGIAFPCNSNPCPIAEGIPNGTHSVDANNGGAETFTDNIFVQGGVTNREFAYLICFYTNTTVSFTGVNKFGQSQTLPVSGASGEGHTLTVTGGPPVPASFACPA
jgi:hypothetical protein